ncbi:MAG: NUDIX domain-containing protein [Candidatus Paceibacterota bacterium]
MKIGFDFIGITTPFYCHDGKGNILMHKRTTECRDEHGRWDTGSGKMEFDLSMEENVLQEVLEEYGCKGVIEGELPAHDIFREQDGQKTHWIAVPFFIKVNPDEVINGEPHKIEEIKWFPINELPEPLHTGFAFTFNRYKKEFEEYFVKSHKSFQCQIP